MFLFSLFATMRVGAIFVPLSFRLTRMLGGYKLGDSYVSVLIADA